MAKKLSAAAQAQFNFLQSLPPQFDRIHRLIEEMSALRLDEARVRSLTRQLDQLKTQAASLSLAPLADTFGMMSMLARRGGGMQLKVRGLREGLASLKINLEGAVRSIQNQTVEAADDAAPGDGGR